MPRTVMTFESTAPSLQPAEPSFHLWCPRTTEPGTELRVDLRAAGSEELRLGSDALIVAVLDALEVKDRPRSWSLERLRSPYYALRIPEATWRDRLPQAWELRIHFPGPLAALPRTGPAGVPITAIDDTWDGAETTIPDREPVRTVVIADVTRQGLAAFQRNAALQRRPGLTIETWRLDVDRVQLRLDLGMITLPDSEPVVEALRAQLAALAAATHCERG